MKLKRVIIMLAAVMLAACAFADGIVRNVTMRKLEPWNGLVEISYELTRDAVAPEGRVLSTRVTVRDKSQSRNYLARTFTTSPSYNAGKHRLVWNAEADGGIPNSANAICQVCIFYAPPPPLYCVISLSTDTAPGSYTVSYLSDVPEGGWTDEYKTTKLVLRRIEPGYVPTRDCQITKPFYVGVFEVTQHQWNLVMENGVGYSINWNYPCNGVSYNEIRGAFAGAGWPVNLNVDEGSFVYKLRQKTGLMGLDLPTEAQWEYACRAGTTTDYNNGTNCSGNICDSNLDIPGMYYANGGCIYSSAYTTSPPMAIVGSFMPNAWGLYDMHGNAREWCLDWYGGSLTGYNPVGATSGDHRVIRGGDWFSMPNECTSGYRNGVAPSSTDSNNGFRLALNLELE